MYLAGIGMLTFVTSVNNFRSDKPSFRKTTSLFKVIWGKKKVNHVLCIAVPRNRYYEVPNTNA